MLYRTVKMLRTLLMRSPLWLCLLVGRFIGLILYASPRRRFFAFKNIKSVFPGESNKNLRRIIYRSFINMGLSVVELMIAPRIFKYIQARGLENLSPRGGIVVAVHEGSWELFNAFLAQNADYAILAREQKAKGLDFILNELRSEYKINVCFSLKGLIRHIRQKHYVGMVVDHGAEDGAVIVKFFSHFVPAPGGAVYLAKKFGLALFPCFGRRVSGFNHVAWVMPPVDPGKRSEAEVLQELNVIYEEQLRKYPAEYLWHYKRFKKKRDLDIVILNDGKTGHLKQSLAFLAFLRKRDYYIRHKIVDVRFKHPRARNLADFFALFMGKRSTSAEACLKWSLAAPVYQELAVSYADVVISAGSFLASVNKMFSASVGAKSVAILRPNIPLYKFDVAIMPEHDRVGSESTIKIKGALCYPTDVEDKVRRCREFFKLGPDKKIAVFIGGVLSDRKEFMINLRLFCRQLKTFSQKDGYKLLISTSRRTPEEADALVKEFFYKCDNVEALVFSNQDNHDFVFDGFVSLADIAFISGESISMLSEAASLQKPCAAVSFEKNEGKHKVFLEMVSADIPLLQAPYDFSGMKFKPSTIFQENSKILEEAIARLF